MNIVIGVLMGTAAYFIATLYTMRYYLGPMLKASREQYELVDGETDEY
jgi:hypothetical protein